MQKRASKPVINFFYPYRKCYIRNSTGLKSFITMLFINEGKRLESMNYVFCSDYELLKINKEYLGHNYFTDIITFNLSEHYRPIKGEAYMSIDRVKANAFQMKISFRKELLRVIFHGSLHLCGYNDKTKSQKAKMRKKEDYYLSLYLNK